MSQRILLVVLLGASCCMLHGCKPSYQQETAPVTGTVTLDGKPLTGGGVMFQPKSGRGAIGEIGPDGTYSLRTYGSNDGASIGLHQVAVLGGAPANEEEAKSFKPLQIPSHYSGAESSGLAFEVKPGVDNVFNIELTTDTN